MSEHAWTQEHIAVAVAGGLDAADAERLDAHVRDCSACADALADARALDRGLSTLFTAARPGPAVEDRLIRSLWAAPARRAPRSQRFWPKVLWGVAASVGLGLTGAAVTLIAGEGGLPLPGATSWIDASDNPIAEVMKKGKSVASNNLKPWTSIRDDLHISRGAESMQGWGLGSVTVDNPDIGLDPKIPTNYDVDRIEDVSGTLAKERDQFKSQKSERNSGILRSPEQMARELSDKTIATNGTTWSLPPAGHFRSYADGEADRLKQHGDGTSNTVTFSDGSAHRPSQIPPSSRPVTYLNGVPVVQSNQAWPVTPPVVAAISPDGGAVASSSGVDGIKLWDAQTGRTPPRLGFEFKPGEHTWKESPAATKAPYTYTNNSGSNGKVTTTVTKAVVENGQYKLAMPVAPALPEPAADPKPQPPAPNAPPPAPEPVIARKVIRSGDIEFEIESFDSAVAAVTQIVGKIKGGYVATVNSDKLANGKMKGTIVVRVPPDALDNLVLDLRKELGKGGELKGQKIGSQDITKQYFDLESRLKAARTMETRLLQIIREGKGEIKQLLDAEKELGVWRTRIEEYEGELRFYANQVSLSTLTIALAEKEIKAAAGLTETEIVKTGIEVEDVDKALQDAIAAVTAAKGRVTKSELKQMAAGQFNAILNVDVAPDAAGPLRDRLRQIGHQARLEIERVQTAEGGTPQRDAKVKRGDTQFFVQLYNLVAVAPRETVAVSIAATDVAAAYQTLQDAVSRAKGRVIDAKVDENDRQNVTAQLVFEIRRGDEAAVQTALAAAGDVITRNVTRAPEGENVTDAKVRVIAKLESAARMRPRESTTLGIEVERVDAEVANFAAMVAEAKGRTVEAHVAHERSGRVTAKLVYDVPLASAAGVVERFKSAGNVRVLATTRDAQAPEGRLAIARIDVTLSNAELIVPRDDGLWQQVRNGLSWSARVLMVSVSWLVVGACVIVPWAAVGYGVYRLVRRAFRPSAPAA